MIRLNKILAHAGVASRRLADELIRQGRVEINGHVVTELGTKADPSVDRIVIDGRKLKADPERRYLLMNKPKGVVSTRSDPQGRRTVLDVLAQAGVRTGYFYPVGRLDYDSEGLLILTNDGDFAERVMHPRYELARTYEALVEGEPDARDIERLRKGIRLEEARTRPAEVRVKRVLPSKKGPQTILEITLHEGRNRQVRRMCDSIAHPVARLRRTRIGPITDASLKAGAVRDLKPSEIKALVKDQQ